MEKVEAVSPQHHRPTATAQPFLLTEDHQLNLTPDLRIDGDYDMRRFVDAYAIADLSGLKVLGWGRSGSPRTEADISSRHRMRL
jgi:hypothetical protein